ncbi:MAG: hypothetical protein KAS23_00500 [Anaerohalosphaera sp.]|nr:hypothetical protein [Anaerohalosphaera sp.]
MTKKAAIDYFGPILIKQALPLQKPFKEINTSKLASYNVTYRDKIQDDVEEALGTKEYIQWMLEDTEVDNSSPVRFCSLFITYYTGNPDQVPHVPDVCYTGAGNELMSNSELTLRVTKNLGDSEAGGIAEENDFPVRHLVLRQTGKNIYDIASEFSVLYFFKANGKYAHSRTGVRLIMQKNLFGKYSYFSKVEWRFHGIIGNSAVQPNEDEIIQASNKLLSIILPVLEEDHWPDWEKANSKETTN